jgi:3-methylcrotonyl-CoA carboxylase alpha subunit
MPGKVVRVVVGEGQAVEAGAVLVVLEAMKMEHSVRAPEAGIVTKLAVREGDQVDGGAVLAVVTPA